jgi:hypothetical protein
VPLQQQLSLLEWLQSLFLWYYIFKFVG